MNLPLLAVGDFAVAVLALVVVAYEGFLQVRFPRTSVHGWAAGVAASAAVYAAFQGIQYCLLEGTWVAWVVRVQVLALISIAWCMAGFSEATTDRRRPAAVRAMGVVLWACVVAVLGTDLVVAAQWDPREVSFLDHPMPQPRMAPATSFFFVFLLLHTGLSVAWLSRFAPRRDERLAYGVASCIWVLTATVDAISTSGTAVTTTPSLLEYGFLVMAGSLLAVDVRHYAQLLQTSEQTKARSEESFRLLIDRVPISTIIHRQGRVVYANPAASTLLGYRSATDMLGLPALELVHPDERAEAMERIRRAVEAGEVPGIREERIRKADGTYLPVEVVAVPTLYVGEPAVVVMGQDVSERRSVTARMMHLDRMIAVGTLAAGVAHEINNPLAYVMGNVEFALKEIHQLSGAVRAQANSLDAGEALVRRLDDVTSALGDAQNGAERVRRIVRDLRTLSRGQDDRREPVVLLPVLESAISMAFNEIKHRARLVKDFAPVPRVLVNDSRLGQVFLNLLINAAQAIPEGRAEDNTIRVRTRTNDDGFAVVEIQDSGQGIPDELRARIFDPFFTTKPVGQGTGLGLSICQGIVRECGGDVRFETEKGKGTTFVVTLPPAPAHAVAAAAAEETADTRVQRRRVMVIDDEPLVGTAVRRLLEQQHDVVVLASARDAMVRLDSGETFDAILCDLMMPDVTGMEFFELVRTRHAGQETRVVFMTGGAFTPQAREFIERIPNRWIEKPVDGAVLQRMMRGMAA